VTLMTIEFPLETCSNCSSAACMGHTYHPFRLFYYRGMHFSSISIKLCFPKSILFAKLTCTYILQLQAWLVNKILFIRLL